MKIEINNLGPVHRYEFDLSKDLNVIFGKNNIGKSYAITAIYLIIKNLTSDSFKRLIDWNLYIYGRHFLEFEPANGPSRLLKEIIALEKKLVVSFKEKHDNELSITDEIKLILSTLIQVAFVDNLEESFKTSFSSIEALSNKLSGKAFSIFMTYDNFTFMIIEKHGRLVIGELNVTDEVVIKRAASTRKPIKSENKHILYFNEKKKKINMIEFVLSAYLSGFRNEVLKIINKVYFLPASRSGLYQALSAFSAVIAELSKSRNFLTTRIELPNISEPVSDYFLFLSQIQEKQASKKYIEIVNIIEEEVLGGEILFNKETKKIVFSQKKIETDLDLAFTSSMISEIAPIVAFLKYIIHEPIKQSFIHGLEYIASESNTKATNLIFIEEPEAHLHPEVQIKLMKLFSMLINYDVKIVMTSHSNYMFNKLSNLILSMEVNYEKVGSYLMRMTEEGSVIDVVSMQADSEGMRDENFADVAIKLYEERISIYERLNKNAGK